MSVSDSNTNNFPLWVFLYMYQKANHECYIEYMRGAKALANWLGELDFPSYEEKELNSIPSLLQGYESNQLARILYETYFQKEEFKAPNTEILHLLENTITLCIIDNIKSSLESSIQ